MTLKEALKLSLQEWSRVGLKGKGSRKVMFAIPAREWEELVEDKALFLLPGDWGVAADELYLNGVSFDPVRNKKLQKLQRQHDAQKKGK